jgi:hypothetical protein
MQIPLTENKYLTIPARIVVVGDTPIHSAKSPRHHERPPRIRSFRKSLRRYSPLIFLANPQVTGGARGLGFVQVEALIEAGASGVWGFDRLPTPDPKYQDLRKKYPDQSLEYKQVDVTNSADLKKAFREVTDWKGRLDGLVAAAGVQYEAPALDYTTEDFRRILDINVYCLPFVTEVWWLIG